MRILAILLGTASLVACATTEPQKPAPANPKLVEGMVRAYTGACAKGMEGADEVKKQKLVEFLKYNNMEIRDYCECVGQTLFGTMNQEDFRQFYNDSASLAEELAKHEPWKSRIETAAINCMVGVRSTQRPGALTASADRPERSGGPTPSDTTGGAQ